VYRTSQGEETQKGISLCRGPQTEKTGKGLKVDHHYGNKKGNILDVYSMQITTLAQQTYCIYLVIFMRYFKFCPVLPVYGFANANF